MDTLYELSRIMFVVNRDGAHEGKIYAKRLMTTYTGCCKLFRKKHGRPHPFRDVYLRSAWSARHIMRKEQF